MRLYGCSSWGVVCPPHPRARAASGQRVPCHLFVYGKDYLALPRAPETWLVKGLLPAGGLLNIYGPPKEGKTYAALGLALAITNPATTEWLEWEIPESAHGPVAYLQLDMPRSAFMTETLEGKLIGNGHDISGIAFADSDLDDIPKPFNILGDGMGWLQSAVSALKPKVVIVDTFREAHGADENDSGVMRNALTALRRACFIDDVSSPAIILLSHSKKAQADHTPSIMAGNRGSNYVAGKMDTIMRVDNGIIEVAGRFDRSKTLTDYNRDPDSWLWRRFDVVKEQMKDLQTWPLDPRWPSAHAMHKAFAKRWGKADSTAASWFKTGHPSTKK